MSWYSIVRRGGVADVPLWTPSSIANLYSWYDADSLSLADGATVSSWTDSSGNGRTMALSGSGAAAVFKTNVINSLPVVRLSAGHFESTGTIAGTCCVTAGVVLERDSAGGTTGYVSGSAGSQATRSFLFGTISNTNLYFGSFGSTTYDYRPSFSWTAGNFHVLTARSDHAAGTFRSSTDGTVQNNVTGLGTGNLIGTATTTYIGRGDGVGQHFGDYAEVVLCESALSDADCERLEGYLAHKWGLTANLPVAHPYKTVAPTV